MENSRIDTRLIQQYLEGKLDPGLMHQLEKEALNDPFLADALEGYSYAKKPMDHQLSILQRQLEQRIAVQQENKNRFNYSWQRLSVAAAAGLIFITAGILFWMRFEPAKEFSKSEQEVVSREQGVVSGQQSAISSEGADTDSSISREIYESPAIAKNYKKLPGTPLSSRKSSDMSVNSEPAAAIPVQQAESSGKEQASPAAFEDFIVSSPAARKSSSDATSKSTVNSIISGKVVSAKTGEVLPGSSILLNGKATGISTNASGEFKIAAGANDTLQAVYVGFGAAKIKAEPGGVNEIRLNEDAQSLAEVVTVGYGSQKREIASAQALASTSSMVYPQLASSGSEDFYQLYLKNNLRLPEGIVSGKVQVGFSVGQNGTLSEFKVLKGLTDAGNAEAIRLIKEGPAWKPGRRSRNVKITIDFNRAKERY